MTLQNWCNVLSSELNQATWIDGQLLAPVCTDRFVKQKINDNAQKNDFPFLKEHVTIY